MHNKTSLVKYIKNVMFSTNKTKILDFFLSLAYLKFSYSYTIKLKIDEYFFPCKSKHKLSSRFSKFSYDHSKCITHKTVLP